MLQAMRERVKVIYWVVIVSFVGLMFLVWGVGDWNAPATSGSDGVVAVVGDTEISAQVWRQRANSIRDQMRARQGTGQSLTENQMMRARDQAFEELRTLDPQAPVVFVSGYWDRDLERKLRDMGALGFVQKPYEAATLRDAIVQAMTAQAS